MLDLLWFLQFNYTTASAQLIEIQAFCGLIQGAANSFARASRGRQNERKQNQLTVTESVV
jgi:hypothetical protein